MFFTLNLRASYKSEIYSAYVNNKMDKWKSVIDEMSDFNPKSNDFLLELLNYQYGYIGWCVGNKKNSEAKKYLDLAEKNLQILSDDDRYVSLVNSYQAAFYGYRIGLNKFLAPFIGLKSIDCAKLAISSDEDNPFGYVQYANIQFYMPAVFGGSKKEALEYYIIAQELMEKQPGGTTENWNYLSLLTVIAQSYSYMDDFQSSLSYLDKILRIEPDFGWVKNELYPQVLKKMKE